MALQSEVSPTMVGDPNKDTKIDGDTKSDDNDSGQSTEEDLEEGEILDSGNEEEAKDFTNSSLKEALDPECLKSIEQLITDEKNNVASQNAKNSPLNSPKKLKKRSKYLDHDQFDNSDQEDDWYTPHKRKSKHSDKPIDYRMELEAYRGTPPSSPERKHKDKESKKRKTSKKSKSSKKTIKRKDIKGVRVSKYNPPRTKICKFFKEGKCNKGADCAYSHSSHLLSSSLKKKELCKFYLSGHCNKGKDCLYMHGEFPCKFYHTGAQCYAKDDCRFSHSPLTEETKRILADYLRMYHGDDDYERKRKNSPSPEPKGPPPKRVCLLGSPPRHIREAEETKRWQEEMKLLQQQHHPGFEICIKNPAKDGSPPPMTKPNFYQDTLADSPSPKKLSNPECRNSPPPNFNLPGPPGAYPGSNPNFFNRPSPSQEYEYDEYADVGVADREQEPDDFGWKNMHNISSVNPLKTEIEPFVDPVQPDLDFTSDVKFDETTQFSEMENSTDCNSASSNMNQISIKKEIEEENSNQENISAEDKKDIVPSQEPTVPSIVIPSHLPRKQQELFKRIQKHQQKHALSTTAISDVSNSPKAVDNGEIHIKQEECEFSKTKNEKEFQWSSSDDDDDDEDIIKKLNQPQLVKQVQPESRPSYNIMEMLSKIQQNVTEKDKSTQESQPAAYFQNLFGGILDNSTKVPGLNNSIPDIKRRTLLPDPHTSAAIKKEPLNAPKDPRLKNRDPRALTSNINKSSTVLSSISTEQNALSVTSLSSKDTVVPKFSTSIESVQENIPYRLYGINTAPLNYTPYINASQSNPKLLSDPRLRKHMNRSQEGAVINIKTEPVPKDVPPIPKLLLKFEKANLNINIFEPTPKPQNEVQDPRQKPKIVDPRIRRRESQNSNSSDTQLIISEDQKPCTEIKQEDEKSLQSLALEKARSLPTLEPSWNIPVKEENSDDDDDDMPRLEIDMEPHSDTLDNEQPDTISKPKPVPASHLPRAIADPRLAKLHTPLDSRRTRSSTAELNKIATNKELKKNQVDSSSLNSETSDSESIKTSKSMSKKSRSSNEKKKTIHRNRRSSMDYASPLNSCDNENSNKNLSYNSYNQRPLRTGPVSSTTDNLNSVASTDSLLSDFLSDNSNLDCDSSDVNLKDKFKTIDPTASPFC